MFGGRSGLVARRGLARGAASRDFSAAELAAALARPPPGNVYLELDGAGRLTARGGPAAAALAARLAPHAGARTAELALRRGALRLRLAADVPPLAELLLWPDAAAQRALLLPHLAPHNIAGSKCYTCHRCPAEFEQPNPLKLHLLLGCRPLAAADFWAHCLRALLQPPPPSPPTAPPASTPPSRPSPPSPAALEALAAAWGRSRDGHVCVYCGKLYSRKYGLKIHIRTHTGYKPLRCRHCLRAFGDPSNLNKHVRLHAARAAPPAGCGAAHAAHACGLCGAALARRRDLERHVRARHPAHPAPAAAARQGAGDASDGDIQL